MKIVTLCHPSQGGSGILASELAMALAAGGHEVHLVACRRPFRLLEGSGVRFHEVQVPDYPLFPCPPHDLAVTSRTAQVVCEFGIDIVHAHYAIPHSVMALLVRDMVGSERVKVVTTLHGTDITLVGSHREFFRLTRHVMERSDGLTAVSEWLGRSTMEHFSLSEPPAVVHNFVNTGRFNPVGRLPYPADGEEFRLLHASNLRPVKRVGDVVRVFKEVRERLPARLTIVGDGPEKGLARELVAELGLCGAVDFVPPVRDMADLFRNSHFFLLLSEYEAFGLSALEAMACGTPVAGTCRGGLGEVVRHGEDALLFPPGDVYRTAEGIAEVLADRGKWERMSAAAADRAEKDFGASAIVPKYEDVYRRVAAGERVRGKAGS